MQKNNKYIDLFCGAGGLSLGLEAAGLRLLFSSDVDRNCTETFKHNFKLIDSTFNSECIISGDIQELYKYLGTSRIYNKKIGRVTIKINKERNGFVAYVDGDRLDVYRSQSEAEKASKEFLKQYRRMK